MLWEGQEQSPKITVLAGTAGSMGTGLGWTTTSNSADSEATLKNILETPLESGHSDVHLTPETEPAFWPSP